MCKVWDLQISLGIANDGSSHEQYPQAISLVELHFKLGVSQN